ncbi:MAG: GGDEF domain-containing protein [Armatimonadetes bacterium]|nr:GGDEF domain-containing protein [Armatimonadota bacterium]
MKPHREVPWDELNRRCGLDTATQDLQSAFQAYVERLLRGPWDSEFVVLCRALAECYVREGCNRFGLVGGIATTRYRLQACLQDTLLPPGADEPELLSRVLDFGQSLVLDLLFEIQCLTDTVTGVANRRYLDRVLPTEVNRAVRYDQPLSLVMIDLDFFKRCNDLHGHRFGDAVLRLVSFRLAGRLREVDFLARYGGEEFCAVLPSTPRAAARALAERLREAVSEKPFRLDGQRAWMTASFGVATLGDAGLTAECLVQSADEALYRAKSMGRNRVESWTEARGEPANGSSAAAC